MPDSQDPFIQATELAEGGLLDEALTIFQTIIKTDSNNAIVWNNIGIIQFRQGKYREAVNAFGQATDINPEFTNAWYNKSLALVHLGKDTEALHKLRSGRAVHVLIERLKDKREQLGTRQRAAAALAAIRSYSAIEGLKDRFSDATEDPAIRSYIAQVLHRTGIR